VIQLSLKDLFEVGAHFGHQTHRWNPKMRPYIYGVRHGIHIIDLQKSVQMLQKAVESVIEIVAEGGDVLFVGTKKQARDVVAEEATRCHMHYVNNRWMGGTLTNFKTIKSSIDKLVEMEEKQSKGDYAALTKKERLGIDRMITKLSASLGGIRLLGGSPAVLVVIDPKLERIAIHEGRHLGIPIVAMTDTNCDPTVVDYPVPSNDDAARSIHYIVQKIADAALLGLEQREVRIRNRVDESRARAAEEGETQRADRRGPNKPRVGKGTAPKAYVRRAEVAEEGASTDQGAYSATVAVEVPAESMAAGAEVGSVPAAE